MRYYSAGTGRFLRPDPAEDGVNLYVYCDNDPLNYVDPFGLTHAIQSEEINMLYSHMASLWSRAGGGLCSPFHGMGATGGYDASGTSYSKIFRDTWARWDALAEYVEDNFSDSPLPVSSPFEWEPSYQTLPNPVPPLAIFDNGEVTVYNYKMEEIFRGTGLTVNNFGFQEIANGMHNAQYRHRRIEGWKITDGLRGHTNILIHGWGSSEGCLRIGQGQWREFTSTIGLNPGSELNIYIAPGAPLSIYGHATNFILP